MHKENYPKALELYVRSSKIKEELEDVPKSELAATYDNIGVVHRYMKDYDTALIMLQEALSIRKKELGPNHPLTAMTCNNIAGIYRMQGNFDKALEYFKLALSIREGVLEKDHPEVAFSYNQLGTAYADLREYESALACFLRAYILRIRIFGADNTDTLRSLSDMLVAYIAADRKENFAAWLDRELQEASDLDFAQKNHKHSEQKVNANELCPCGSGKKYKKCCWRLTCSTT